MDLKARHFNCVIQLWNIADVPDGFGGSTIQTTKVADLFARRKELKQNPFLNDGLNIQQQMYRFTIRSRQITSGMFIIYQGFKYDIKDKHVTQLQTQIELDCVNTGFINE